jgi:hypothetical protein
MTNLDKPQYRTVLQAIKAAKSAFEAGKAYEETPNSLSAHAAGFRDLADQILRIEHPDFELRELYPLPLSQEDLIHAYGRALEQMILASYLDMYSKELKEMGVSDESDATPDENRTPYDEVRDMIQDALAKGPYFKAYVAHPESKPDWSDVVNAHVEGYCQALEHVIDALEEPFWGRRNPLLDGDVSLLMGKKEFSWTKDGKSYVRIQDTTEYVSDLESDLPNAPDTETKYVILNAINKLKRDKKL